MPKLYSSLVSGTPLLLSAARLANCHGGDAYKLSFQMHFQCIFFLLHPLYVCLDTVLYVIESEAAKLFKRKSV